MNRRSQQSKGLVAVYLALGLSACTVINVNQKPPSDWPKLSVSVHKLSFYETQKACGGGIFSTLLGVHRFACAWIHFDKQTCTIYTATDDPHVMEHELAHCEGYDHIGSTTLADGWRDWKANNRSAMK